MPIALVTGASSGIGQATARRLAAHGFRVFGTSRTPDADAHRDDPLLPLDVRSDASVQALVRTVLDQAGRIDLLVNNAGYGQSGAVEEVSPAEAQAQFDTNVFGTLHVIQAVLPVMRRQRSGRIVNVSSVLGQVAPPFLGLYATSKFALEGLSEALRTELRPFGIHVSLVEPAFVKSNFVAHAPTGSIADYDAARRSALAFARQGMVNGLDPDTVAATILRIATSATPRLRYSVGRDTRLLVGLKRLLPEPAFERVSRRLFRSDAPRPLASAVARRSNA